MLEVVHKPPPTADRRPNLADYEATRRSFSRDSIRDELAGLPDGRGLNILSALRFVAIVGGGLPLAAGLALADKLQGKPSVTCCFFGEGAGAEGEFHETMNLAALWKLPVLFLCENNLYAMGTALSRSESVLDLARKAESYDVAASSTDGTNVLAVEEAGESACAHVRSGKGPYFLELRTYRFRAHSMFDAQLYRDKAEVETRKARDPIDTFVTSLKQSNLLDDAELARLEAEIGQEMARAVDFAESATLEPVDDLTRFVYTESERKR